MKNIRISDGVWALLKKNAEPFEDSPNDVLERLLNIQPANGNGAAAQPATTTASGRTTQQAFREPIIAALRTLGGKAHKDDVMKELERAMTFTTADTEKDDRGRLVWQQRAAWQAVSMRKAGELKSPKHGIWQLP